jgi:predicted AlkP superfamily phosphohydrolase/phosphomutase
MKKRLYIAPLTLLAGSLVLAQAGKQTAQPAGQANSASSPAKSEALKTIDDLSANLAKLEDSHAKTIELNVRMSDLFEKLRQKAADTAKLTANVKNLPSDLKQSLQSLQETQMSFNLQYLQLQNSMQNENRQFTMVSNIMKTKHDTVKNSISNIR